MSFNKSQLEIRIMGFKTNASRLPHVNLFTTKPTLHHQWKKFLNTQSHCLVTKPCLNLCEPLDCSPPDPSVHGILQARILEWRAGDGVTVVSGPLFLLLRVGQAWLHLFQALATYWGFPSGSVVQNPPANAGDAGLIPGLGRSPGEVNSNLIQNSGLGNPVHRGAWWPMVTRLQFSRSVTSNSLQPHEPQHARPPCPSPTPEVHPNPCPSS